MDACKALSLSLLPFLVSGWPAYADEILTIERLQRNPEFYQGQIVTLQGTVHQIQFLAPDAESDSLKPLDGNPPPKIPCTIARPAYTFVLADDTGFQQILVQPVPSAKGTGLCRAARGLSLPPDVGEKDQVLVDVRVTVSPRSQAGLEQTTLEAHAVTIAVTIRRPGK